MNLLPWARGRLLGLVVAGAAALAPASAAAVQVAQPDPPAAPDATVPQQDPDVAADSIPVVRLAFFVEASGTTATGAMSAARFRSRAVLGALGQSGVYLEEVATHEPEVVQLLESRVVPRGRRPLPAPRVQGYRAWIPITVLTPALHRTDLLIDRAAGAGAYLERMDYLVISVEVDEEPDQAIR